MCEKEVVYADVKFAKRKEEADQSVSSRADTTHSEVKLRKAPTEPPGSRSKVTAERTALLVLIVLLVAAVGGLAVSLLNNTGTKKTLESLRRNSEREINNLTERLSKMKQPSTLIPTCPKPTPVTQNQECKRCEEGWKNNEGMCYFFSTQTSNWTESRKWCQSKAGDLVKIDSKDEQIFLAGTVRTVMTGSEDKFWIGLTDSVKEGVWLWVDDSKLNPSLRFWNSPEPDDWKGKNDEQKDGEDCVRMGEPDEAHDLTCWFDRSCKKQQKFICEKNATDGVFRNLCV